MKYSFRNSDRKASSHIKKGTRLRFAGRNTLKPRSQLPQPIEAIRLEDGELSKKKRDTWAFRRKILGIYKGIYLGLSHLGHGTKNIFSSLYSSAKAAVQKNFSKKRQGSATSLPLLLGALSACVLVCTLTASYIFLSLLSPYVRQYREVTVPHLRGKQLTEIEYPTDSFNLIIQYENNPEIASGQIISQTPSAGVTRRLYGKESCCDILLTVSKQSTVLVPGVTGIPLRNATLALSNCGLEYTVSEEYSDIVARGSVIRSYPSDGSEIEDGGAVRLTVSLGNKASGLRVPSLIGQSESQASLSLHSSGLVLGGVSYVKSSKPMGTVISQSPAPDSSVERGASVSVTVSAGSDFSAPTVPDLYGMSVEAARAALSRVGLTVSSVYSVSSAAPKGAIISQYPLPGTVITSAVISVELHISN